MHFPGRSSARGGEAAASSSSSSAPKKDDSSHEMGRFDPDNLERGAKALAEIDKSKNSDLAFQYVQLEEKTLQLEQVKQAELLMTEAQRLTMQASLQQNEEVRKTVSHTADQERSTAQHKAQVEAQLQQQKLGNQREAMERQLQTEHSQFLRHEEIRVSNEIAFEEERRNTMRAKGEHDRQVALARAREAAAGRAQQERENIEIRLREMRAKKAEERRTALESIEEIFSSMSSGAMALYDDRTKAITLVAGLTALALGVHTAKNVVRVTASVLERNLGRPPLVRETSRWSWRPQLHPWWPFRKETPNIMEQIVLEETLSERLTWTTNALLKAQENGTPFRHLLLYGAPGTGKTLFARTLARQSGLDYAIMSGGDLGPLGRDGPHELHKLFQWANSSRRGLILFIDEADAFLRVGRSQESGQMSEDSRNALSVFLHHTGTESSNISVILATNIPKMLDRAILDRIDERFEFPLPAYEQRLLMMQMFFEQHVRKPTKRGRYVEVDPSLDEKWMGEVAKRTEGFSGRQLAKLALAMQAAVFGSGTKVLTAGLAETVLQWRLANADA
eukprot:gnl/TRDRNA2_/TRDRNA2_35371_c0_seq1.p1 gnl/TRDRNA2_/TRDRNA2_35371_c0~~gnl/TRDRNA2_/TRDRNA2_35371_c0_seq1.p1  ORF type:complete len:563 (-),score=118.38 gnl/TRDRNA2_/TRDRNA2_35371_c0_seq1:45-1733(-)